jgi:hypothetical protein
MTDSVKKEMGPDEIVAHVVANSRLEGLELDDETVSVVRRVATGEMSREEAAAWRKANAQRLQKEKRTVAFG